MEGACNEKKFQLRFYFNLGWRIKEYEAMRETYQEDYFSSHSFTGGMMQGGVIKPYQQTKSVEHHVFNLISIGNSIDLKIAKLMDRQKHFKRYLETCDYKELRKIAFTDGEELTEFELAAIEEINEIELFIQFKYHPKGGFVEEQQSIESAGNILLNRIKDLKL